MWTMFATGTSNVQPQVRGSRKVSSPMDMPSKLSLPVFGLAHYKFRGSIWTTNGVHERQQVSKLLQAAENWLRLLRDDQPGFDHPDFRFFASHNTLWRWGAANCRLPLGNQRAHKRWRCWCWSWSHPQHSCPVWTVLWLLYGVCSSVLIPIHLIFI